MSAAPTIYSLAADLGVHASTVSRAFSRPELISPEIRDRILARAAEVGYHPNPAARSLVTGRSATIGLVLPDIENPFFPPFVRATQDAAARGGRRVILLDTELRADRELELIVEMAKHVDGLLIASPLNPPSKIKSVTGNCPVVLINRGSRTFSSVIVDNSTALHQAITLLADLGHRRIAYLGGPPRSWTAGQRERAVLSWHPDSDPDHDREPDDHGRHGDRAELIFIGGFDASYEGGLQATDALAHTGATAAIAFDDLMACGVIAGLAAHRIGIPDGFSIVGCDDVLISRVLTPPLTTITAPIRRLGEAAVDMLGAILTEPDRKPWSISLPGVLAVRGSTAVPPRRPASFLR